jgi:hypothetical protein
MLAVASIVTGGLFWRSTSAPPPIRVLVVGDSVIAQSASDLRALAPPGVTVAVAAGIGSAPCDWVHGYVDPYNRTYRRFSLELAKARPQYVVLMFTGNPGLSGPSAGCVDADRPYSAASLTSSYRFPLTDMADEAAAAKAAVIFEQPPPRNPAAPTGFDPSTASNGGYQGSPFIGALMQQIVKSAPRRARWSYSNSAAALVSGPGFTYQTWLPCNHLVVDRCIDGLVRVRTGGSDAVHLDPAGSGAILFASGIDEQFGPSRRG